MVEYISLRENSTSILERERQTDRETERDRETQRETERDRERQRVLRSSWKYERMYL